MTSTMTAQDWQALAAAKAAGGGAYLQTLHDQQVAAMSGVPAGGGMTNYGPNAGATSTASSIGQDAITAVENAYPDLAWMLNIPELASIIVPMAQSGVTDQNQVTARLESTGWWKVNSQSVRNWLQEVQTDPAQAQSDMLAQQSTLSATLAQMGLTPTGAQLSLLASQQLALGWTDQEVKDHISSSIQANPDGTFSFNYGGMVSGPSTGGGSLAASVDAIQSEAAKFLVPISEASAQNWAGQLAGGKMTMQGVDAFFQNQALALYPGLTNAIKAGVTPADYAAPYVETAAQLLGVDPKSINMTDPKWNMPLTSTDQSGKPQPMSLYAWQQHLMSNSQYGYMNSVNAKDRASSLAQGIAEMFGRSPSGPAGSTAFTAAGAPRIPGVPIT